MAVTRRRSRARIISITVRVRTREGRERVVSINPRTFDSLFFNAKVAERLLAPYYFADKGFDGALKALAPLHRRVEADKAGAVTLVPHKPWCQYTVLTF
jgi:hypothetical protein